MTPRPKPRYPIATHIRLDIEIEGHPVTVRSKGRLVTIRVLNWKSLFPLFRSARSSSTLRHILVRLDEAGKLTGLAFQVVCGNTRLMTFGMGQRRTLFKSWMGIG